MCTRAGVRTKFWPYDFSSDRVRTSDYTVASGANLTSKSPATAGRFRPCGRIFHEKSGLASKRDRQLFEPLRA